MVEANWLLWVFLALYAGQSLAGLWMERLNIKHMRLHGGEPPAAFRDAVDSAKLAEISSYTADKSRTGSIHGVVSDVILLALILSGLLANVERHLIHWRMNFILAGIVFLMTPGAFLYLAELPFDYYNAFVLEEKYGFNRSTLKIWIVDHIKAGLISLVIFSALLSIILWMIRLSPAHWWIWAFLIVSAIQIMLTVVYPILIAPLFNKFEPVKDETLAQKIETLMEENGIKVKNIFQMDAGRRSRHTNAYFTGLGKTKQIVLYDTLLESHSHEEILSVLAHEVGHFKKRHIVKQVALFELSMFAGFFVTYLLLDWPLLYSTFEFIKPEPYVGIFLIGIFWERAGYFLRPLIMGTSRRFEREADAFAVDFIGTPQPLIDSLKRMAADNLSNLSPHPLYVLMNYSHPPLAERVERLASLARPGAAGSSPASATPSGSMSGPGSASTSDSGPSSDPGASSHSGSELGSAPNPGGHSGLRSGSDSSSSPDAESGSSSDSESSSDAPSNSGSAAADKENPS